MNFNLNDTSDFWLPMWLVILTYDILLPAITQSYSWKEEGNFTTSHKPLAASLVTLVISHISQSNGQLGNWLTSMTRVKSESLLVLPPLLNVGALLCHLLSGFCKVCNKKNSGMVAIGQCRTKWRTLCLSTFIAPGATDRFGMANQGTSGYRVLSTGLVYPYIRISFFKFW